MKKITSLLMMLCMFVGAVNAEVTKYYKPGERLSTLTEGQKVMFYNTCLPTGQDRTGFLIDNAGNFALNKQKPSASPFFSEQVGVWTLENVTNTDGVYTVNVKGANGYVGIGGKTNNADAQVLRFQEWTAAADGKKAGVNSESATGTTVNNADISTEDKVWLVTNSDQSTTWNGDINSFTTWSTGHPYAVYSAVEATTAELEEMLDAAKTAAVNELNPLKQLSDIYSTESVETAIASVNAVALENNDLDAALNAIDALVAQAKLSADGKNVKFCIKATDNRSGKYLGYDKANTRAAAVADGGDAAIWTIKVNADGTFKLYNWVNNHYLGTPADVTPVVAAEANAPSFKFIVTAEDEVAIATGDKMVHIANHTNFKVINHWDTADLASLWTVTVVPEIVVTHEQYNAALAAKATLPWGIQQAYGLVTSGENIKVVVNHPSGGDCQPSSNLLDGLTSSFVHSSYDGNTMDTVDKHYIQANLGEGGVDQFYVYMTPRNANNRPKEIVVSGSNTEDGEYTEIATITTTLASSDVYMSEKLGTVGIKYQYIRLTVNSTNTSTKFFTLSECYFLPATGDSETLISAYHNFETASITSSECAERASTLINGEATLELANTKKDIAALLEASIDKVAEPGMAPALGQYPFDKYHELEVVYESPSATQATLDQALSAFKKSKNVPVYIIKSAWNDGYPKGSAIFYNGSEWRWKAPATVYDRQMWMTIPDYDQENVPVVESYSAGNTSYEICDYTTGKVMRDKKVQIVKVPDWDGVYSLQYIADGNSTDAAQHAQAGGALVSWKTAKVNDCQASGWIVQFIGTSYELDQLTDEYFEQTLPIVTDLANVSVPNFEFSEGAMNCYDPATKPALDAAVANRSEVLCTFYNTVEELTIAKDAAKTQLTEAINGVAINMPVNGKFYRLRCVDGQKYLQCTQNTDANRFDMIAGSGGAGTTVTATFCYINGGLVAYSKPMYIGHEGNTASFNMEPVAVIFQKAGDGSVGQYNIKLGTRYLYGKNNKSDSGAYAGEILTNTDGGYRWWLEEVTSIPVTISAAGYATFYTPVALTLPAEGLKAYTVTVNGEFAMLNEIEGGVIPANTGVVLEGAEGTYNLTVGGSADEIGNNDLDGTVAASYVTEDAYVLGIVDEKVGFYTATKNQQEGSSWLNNGFKAYIRKDGHSATLRLNFGGTTAIESVLNGVDANAPIYDLSGRRVNNAVKGGIYIQNGKKFIVK